MMNQREKGKKADRKVKSLRGKSLSTKQAKGVKGGYEGRAIANYNFENAWPKK
jgi:hypothetical protein